MTGRDECLHQLVFGLDERGARREMGVLASSFPAESPQSDVWHERLKPFYRLGGTTSTAPDSALSYLEFPDGTAAVLRRRAVGPVGRGRSRALVGSAEVLYDTAPCLDGWLAADVPTPLRPVAAPELGRTTPPDTEEARQTAHRMLAALLADPTAGLTVIGARRGSELSAVHLLRQALAPIVEGRGPRSFSTYEVDDDAARLHLPRLVFVPVMPTGATTHRRLFVDAVLTGDDAAVAAELLDLCLHRPAEYAAIIRKRTLGTWDPDQRLRRLRGPAAAKSRAVTPSPLVGAGVALADDETMDLTHRLPTVDPPPAEPEPEPRAADMPPRPLPLTLDAVALFDRAAEATAAADLRLAVEEMKLRIAEVSAEERNAIQGRGAASGFLAPVISAVVADPEERIAVFVGVLQYAFGPSGCELAVPRRTALLATSLVEQRVPADLVGAALAVADRAHVADRLHRDLSRAERAATPDVDVEPHLVALPLPWRLVEPARRAWLLHRGVVLAALVAAVLVLVVLLWVMTL